uniref:Uncharacterized protein n=1 Tax=Oryza sativa subsp. japonica TaxID=39947 RepID=Q6ZKI3_ORYSJ|nr:hypothetical protein [Oryza sativa Japonica Group]
MPASSLVYLQSQSGISGTHFIPFFDLRFSVVHYFRSYCLDHELFLVVPADAVYTVHDCLFFLPLLICPPVTMDASPLRPAPPHAFPWPPSRRRAATAIVNTTDGDASPLRARGSTISHHLIARGSIISDHLYTEASTVPEDPIHRSSVFSTNQVMEVDDDTIIGRSLGGLEA